MLDAKRLLDQFLGSTPGASHGTPSAPHGTARPTVGHGGSHGVPSGGLGSTLAGLGSGLGSGVGGGFGSGAAVGGLVGLLLGGKSSRKLGGKALTYGGMAVLGGLAYKAWQDWQAGKAPATEPQRREAMEAEAPPPPPAGSRFLPDERDEARQANLSLALIRAMISAAKSDGHIDADEQQRIFRHVNEAGLSAEEKAFVMDELAKPLDIDAVVAGADSPEAAAEIYAASLLAIDPDTPAERGYLSMLAGRLGLEPALVEHLHANVERVTQ